MLVRLDGSDRQMIHHIRGEAERWLSTRGTDQYQRGIDPVAVRRTIDQEVDAGQFVGWKVDGRIVAVAALIEPDDELWTPEEVAEPQTYLSRVLVGPGQHGHGYGAALIGAIDEQAAKRGDRWLRLNCWTTNTRLHDYYRAHGFEYVRTSDRTDRMSGALFQRAVSSDRGLAASKVFGAS